VIAGVLLAAGGASRFGSQKLVAPLGGIAVVRLAALALAPHVDELIVVVGSEADAVRAVLADMTVRLVDNPQWSDGLSTSLQRGVAALPVGTEAVLIALGDQPVIDPAVFVRLLSQWHETARPIVAARYRGILSPPVLLARSIFGEVTVLEGDVGARPIIQREPHRVAFVDIDSDPPRDVDTVPDLRALDGQ
jgi:molybdenum cofactor cytidylyltransferase